MVRAIAIKDRQGFQDWYLKIRHNVPLKIFFNQHIGEHPGCDDWQYFDYERFRSKQQARKRVKELKQQVIKDINNLLK